MRPVDLAFACALLSCPAVAAPPPNPPIPLSPARSAALRADPARYWALTHPTAPARRTIGTPPPGSPWQSVPHAALPNPGAMLLLTDGRILVQDQGPQNNGSGNWWTLTPDLAGSYATGTWTQAASLPSDYQPLYFASAILPDGRVIIEGGEYNLGSEAWTNQGAIYDPVANSWTAVAPPDGGTGQWVRIGDGPGQVLDDGTFFLGASGYSGTTAEALLNESTLSWSDTGAGKADGNGEEGWAHLPGGGVLTVDTNNGQNTELYSPATGAWVSAGNTPQSLIDSGEEGPLVTRPDGSVLAVGATGHNAVYSASGAWSAAPDFPVIGGKKYRESDGPAAVLPNGQVLLMASPDQSTPPAHFFLFDGTHLRRTADTPNAATLSSFLGFMLVLPTGQVLFNDRVGGLWLYTSTGRPYPKAAPTRLHVPTSLTAGQTYAFSGVQLSGLTQGAAYGDDYQSATNYPLVRIVNQATGHVVYARTSGFSSYAIAPNAPGRASFTVPPGIETGASTLTVIANGVASRAIAVSINP